MGSGVGAGGAGSGPGPGGRGSGGTWCMSGRYPWALNANGALRWSAPFTEEEGWRACRRVEGIRPTRQGVYSPSRLRAKPTRTQLGPNLSKMSGHGPFALAFATDDGARDVRTVGVSADAAAGRRARAAVDVGVLAGHGLPALGLLARVLAGVARGRLVVGADDAQRVLVGA